MHKPTRLRRETSALKLRVAIHDQLAAAARLHTGEVPSRRTEAGAALLDLASLSALVQPEFVALIHKAIDDAPAPDLDHAWSGLTRAELDARVAALEQELAEVEREERRRPLLEAQAELDAELAALEKI